MYLDIKAFHNKCLNTFMKRYASTRSSMIHIRPTLLFPLRLKSAARYLGNGYETIVFLPRRVRLVDSFPDNYYYYPGELSMTGLSQLCQVYRG